MDAESYQTNKTRRKGQVRRYHKIRAEWHQQYKEGKPCTDCGQQYHHVAMHWDHLPGSVKLDNVSRMVHVGMQESRILSEIAKCELVCANCHAMRTYNRSRAVSQ